MVVRRGGGKSQGVPGFGLFLFQGRRGRADPIGCRVVPWTLLIGQWTRVVMCMRRWKGQRRGSVCGVQRVHESCLQCQWVPPLEVVQSPLEVAWPPLVVVQPPLELAQEEWGGRAGVVATGGTGDMVGGVMVGLGIQLVKMSRNFEMAVSCSWWMAAGESLIAQERNLRAWTMRSPSLTMG